MTEADLSEVMLIEKELFSDPWPEQAFYDDIADNIGYSYVAQLDNRIVGYVMMVVFDRSGHLTNLAVDKKYQRKSIAKKLLSFILELAMREKIARLTLEVRLSNQPAIELYESFGFWALTVKKDYYHNPVEDCLIMMKSFGELEEDWF